MFEKQLENVWKVMHKKRLTLKKCLRYIHKWNQTVKNFLKIIHTKKIKIYSWNIRKPKQTMDQKFRNLIQIQFIEIQLNIPYTQFIIGFFKVQWFNDIDQKTTLIDK